METRDHENSTLAFLTEETTISPRVDQRERIKIEFYKTYDVMTGIRIAATLGGFFSMMILLVLYKNYCKPSKTLSEEQLNAAVTAAAEEEDRALQAVLEATTFYTALEKRRQSMENTNQVLLSPRFSSVGGGYSHLTPPMKVAVLQQRGKSLPGSVLRFGSNASPLPSQKHGKFGFFDKDEDFDTRGDYFTCRNHLNVPPSRRVSSVTCSSTDSAYLERRCSAFEMDLPGAMHFPRKSREKLAEKKEEPWDFYYPIDIQVIQPTPEMSPTASERNLHENHGLCGLQVPGIQDQMHRLSVTSFDIGLAPLASISSLGSFSQSSSQSSKNSNISNSRVQNLPYTSADDSLGSDSVFMDDIDIEDDVEEFPTDSEFEYDGFDDDYSFCESKQRPPSRTEMRTLQFASFDSYDASIGQDSLSENQEEETIKAPEQPEEKPCCKANLKRRPSLHEGNQIRKKLVKTYSEPRNSKILKQLPPWTEKGRSGYIPKRHMSSPSARKTNVSEASEKNDSKIIEGSNAGSESLDAAKDEPSQEDDNAKDLKKFLLPPSSKSSSSDTQITHKSDASMTYTPKQGFKQDLPLTSTQLSPSNTQEKRSRLQKQKNFMEEVKATNQVKEKTEARRLPATDDSTSFPTTSGGLLKPPNIPLTGSCERLANPKLGEEEEASIQINISSCKDDETNQQPPSPSQDQLSK